MIGAIPLRGLFICVELAQFLLGNMSVADKSPKSLAFLYSVAPS